MGLKYSVAINHFDVFEGIYNSKEEAVIEAIKLVKGDCPELEHETDVDTILEWMDDYYSVVDIKVIDSEPLNIKAVLYAKLSEFLKSELEVIIFEDVNVSTQLLSEVLTDKFEANVLLDELEINGWELDFCIPVEISGNIYSIEGSGYFRTLSFRDCEWKDLEK